MTEKKMQVFIADGSAAFLRTIEEMLSGMENVEIAGSSQDPVSALCDICRLRPDLLLLDARLFSAYGMEILRRVKREHWALLIVTLSDEGSRQYRERYLKAGSDYFLYKPEAREKTRSILTGLLNRLGSSGAVKPR